MGIRDIEKAIKNLSTADLARFRRWYEEFDAQVWDEQFEQDAQSGKLRKLADEAIQDYQSGDTSEF